MSNFCYTNKIICEDATSNGYCSLTACRNVRLCGNTIMSEGIYPVEEIKADWSKKPNPWHTGEPTEEGDYLVTDGYDYDIAIWGGQGWYDTEVFSEKCIVAWQKIEPYKA